MALTTQDKQWYKTEMEAGRTYEEISIGTGNTVQSIKRALADIGYHDLSWYKTNSQHELLTLLRENGIHTINDLRKYKLIKR